MELYSKTLAQGGRIPERCAYGRLGESGETVPSDNLNPHLAWLKVPEGTRAYVVACLDDDVPTDFGELVDGELPAWQPRRRFVHWVQANVPAEVTEIAEGALSNDSKLAPGFGLAGVNDYSRGNPVEPGAVGTGYDGPCPPGIDSRHHVYRWIVAALDAELQLPEVFTWSDVAEAMKGHVLACSELQGFYSLNPRLAERAGTH